MSNKIYFSKQRIPWNKGLKMSPEFYREKWTELFKIKLSNVETKEENNPN